MQQVFDKPVVAVDGSEHSDGGTEVPREGSIEALVVHLQKLARACGQMSSRQPPHSVAAGMAGRHL
jgi:hypothetical protein